MVPLGTQISLFGLIFLNGQQCVLCPDLQQKLHLVWCWTCKMGPFTKVVGFRWGLLTNPIPLLLGAWPLFVRIMFNDLLPTSNFFKVSLSSKFSFWRVSRSWHFMHGLKLSWCSAFNLSKLQIRLSILWQRRSFLRNFHQSTGATRKGKVWVSVTKIVVPISLLAPLRIQGVTLLWRKVSLITQNTMDHQRRTNTRCIIVANHTKVPWIAEDSTITCWVTFLVMVMDLTLPSFWQAWCLCLGLDLSNNTCLIQVSITRSTRSSTSESTTPSRTSPTSKRA